MARSPRKPLPAALGLGQARRQISIDVDRRKIDLDVPDTELAARRQRLRQRAGRDERGWLSIYERNVQPLPKGLS